MSRKPTPRIADNSKGELHSRLHTWFHAARRDLPWRQTSDPYRIWVSEVMLQQTQVTTVVPYYLRFVSRYPDISVLAAADLQDVLKHWEGMGYYARARNLHAAAKIIAGEMGGRIPENHAAFRALPGVGDYIAAAVMSIARDEPYAALDGNVKRVLSRLFSIGEAVNSSASAKTFRRHADDLLDTTRPGDYNQAMMELGAVVCKPKTPQCPTCPITSHCRAFLTGQQHKFPVRRARRKVPEYRIAVGIITKGGRILITRRKPEGLLGGMWEFPGGKVLETESPEAACAREIREETNLQVEVTDYLTHVDHAYSHFKIAVDVYACEYRAGRVELNGPVDYRWILVDEIDRYPFPRANHKFIPLVKERVRG